VKYHNKSILLFIMIFILITMNIGCTGSNSIIPEVNPNPTVNPNNNTVSYVKVSTTSPTIKINQSLQFVVKGYNSNDEWVILDKNKIKLWKWTVHGCYDCFKDHVDLNPKSSSLTTTFTSDKAGTFFIGVYYKENVGDEYKTDFTELIVTN